jgi:pentatricopeptide repeat protein
MRSLIDKQLHHFDDPFHMAKHVESELTHGRFEQALVFTRKASASAKCVVSWNYLIKHLLREQKARAAIKLYNEVSSTPD